MWLGHGWDISKQNSVPNNVWIVTIFQNWKWIENKVYKDEQGIGRWYSTCVTVNVNMTYATTESEVIHAKGAPNL